VTAKVPISFDTSARGDLHRRVLRRARTRGIASEDPFDCHDGVLLVARNGRRAA
jgi:hypothetical protein